jgi:hypothetical protein
MSNGRFNQSLLAGDKILKELVVALCRSREPHFRQLEPNPDVTKTHAAHRFEIEKGPPLWLKGGATQPSTSTTKGL